MKPLTYHDATGAVHEVVARKTAAGDWEILDTCAGEELVIESLDGASTARRKSTRSPMTT